MTTDEMMQALFDLSSKRDYELTIKASRLMFEAVLEFRDLGRLVASFDSDGEFETIEDAVESVLRKAGR